MYMYIYIYIYIHIHKHIHTYAYIMYYTYIFPRETRQLAETSFAVHPRRAWLNSTVRVFPQRNKCLNIRAPDTHGQETPLISQQTTTLRREACGWRCFFTSDLSSREAGPGSGGCCRLCLQQLPRVSATDKRAIEATRHLRHLCRYHAHTFLSFQQPAF